MCTSTLRKVFPKLNLVLLLSLMLAWIGPKQLWCYYQHSLQNLQGNELQLFRTTQHEKPILNAASYTVHWIFPVVTFIIILNNLKKLESGKKTVRWNTKWDLNWEAHPSLHKCIISFSKSLKHGYCDFTSSITFKIREWVAMRDWSLASVTMAMLCFFSSSFSFT